MEPSLEQQPTDEAFAKLPAVTVDDLVKSENKTLTKIFTCHVVPGKREASDLTGDKKLKTVEGEELTVKNSGTLQCSGAISVTVMGTKAAKDVNYTVQQASDGKISASVAQFDGANHLGRTKNLSSPSAKKFSLFFSGKSVAFAARPVRKEGRWPSSRTLEQDAVDAATSSRA